MEVLGARLGLVICDASFFIHLCSPCPWLSLPNDHCNPVLFAVPYLDTTICSFGIAEKCTRHEKILNFLTSGSEDVDKGELDLSLLSDLIQLVMFGVHQHPYASLIYPSGKFDALNPLPDFVGEMIRDSKLTVNSDGQVVFANSGTEIKDILLVVAEFLLSSNSTSWRKQEVDHHQQQSSSMDAREDFTVGTSYDDYVEENNNYWNCILNSGSPAV